MGGGGLAVPADRDALGECRRRFVADPQHRTIGLDQHLHESFRQSGLIAFAKRPENDEIRDARLRRQAVAEIALHFAQRDRHVVGTHGFGKPRDASLGADLRERRFHAFCGFVARVLCRLHDFLYDHARDAIGEECQSLSEVGTDEECNDVRVERTRGFDRMKEHGDVATASRDRYQDLCKLHGLACPPSRNQLVEDSPNPRRLLRLS